jgi:hypothetical protein
MSVELYRFVYTFLHDACLVRQFRTRQLFAQDVTQKALGVFTQFHRAIQGDSWLSQSVTTSASTPFHYSVGKFRAHTMQYSAFSAISSYTHPSTHLFRRYNR